jgi:hypothetical protein
MIPAKNPGLSEPIGIVRKHFPFLNHNEDACLFRSTFAEFWAEVSCYCLRSDSGTSTLQGAVVWGERAFKQVVSK